MSLDALATECGCLQDGDSLIVEGISPEAFFIKAQCNSFWRWGMLDFQEIYIPHFEYSVMSGPVRFGFELALLNGQAHEFVTCNRGVFLVVMLHRQNHLRTVFRAGDCTEVLKDWILSGLNPH
ncbi:hypothetical protein CISG_09710 [Coccidioides immitis RMSCC 3703]|uniref:Uncharacterized protein n=2 Tax=Coccidioides immitis TaxID=5501 RepID=A0A0J8QKD6_COCIT|nr:hypothetical protein CIRG_09805 [Coccidioides immitis RMSCC 2394]KMU72911.1 hypothetical protein CISG_09710 [Coccidioides immitis RMSCC 3703]